jgi:hypothetical protein
MAPRHLGPRQCIGPGPDSIRTSPDMRPQEKFKNPPQARTGTSGYVYTFGDAPYFGAPGPQSSPITSMVRTPDGKGYWLLDADGQVLAMATLRTTWEAQPD